MYKVYQVLEGDTLNSISRKLNVSIEDLKGINGIEENTNITPGSFLVVPAQKSIFMNYTIQKADTLYNISQRYGVTLDNLLQLNGMKEDEYLYPGSTILIPNQDTKIYITKDNDTLESVADRLSTSISNIVSDNDNIYLLPNQLLIYKKR